jgi:hypothetical protein
MAPAVCRAMSTSQVVSSVAPQFQRGAPRPAKNQRVSALTSRERRLIALLSLLSALSCFAGGIEVMTWRAGERYVLPPLGALMRASLDNLRTPGMLLAWMVAGVSLVGAILNWRNARAALGATLFAGGALSVWTASEIAILRRFGALSGLNGALALLLLGLSISAAWRSNAPRYRWWIVVTLAEAIGFMVPAAIGIATAKAGIEGAAQAWLLVAGGALEGVALGAGQAWAFPLPVHKARYIACTALGAAFAWASAMAVVSLAAAPSIPTFVTIGVGVSAGVLGVWAMGAAQWIELRRHTVGARRWIAWTALAWILALPFSFAPGPFVDETTPFSSQIVLWAMGGLSMACVMALVTWQGVRRITAARG